MTDTEHILCKIYICALFVHPSRTVSETKGKSPEYCWPLYEPYRGLEQTQAQLERIWNLFVQDENGVRQFIKDEYPKDFDYQEAFYLDPSRHCRNGSREKGHQGNGGSGRGGRRGRRGGTLGGLSRPNAPPSTNAPLSEYGVGGSIKGPESSEKIDSRYQLISKQIGRQTGGEV